MKALISGTFDPVTVGHLDVIRRAASLFEEVYAVVFNNTEKKCLFDLGTRRAMLSAACGGLSNVKVDVCDGLLAAYAEEHDIGVIVRGIRDASDVPYEMMLATINRGLRHHPDTVFIPAKPENFHISSSYVKNMIQYGEDLTAILPDGVLPILTRSLSQ